MAERIILSLCCFLCAVAFFLIGRLCRVKSTPVAFWSGGEKALEGIVKDALGYNREMAAAFRNHGLGWLLAAMASAFSPLAGLLCLASMCTLGLFLLWKRYKQLLSKYS